MNIFSSLHLKNTGPFKNQKFEFSKGITAIYGLNKTNARKSTNANGAGKSFLFSQISEILYDNPVVGEKADKIKSGTRTLTINVGGKNVQITRKNTKLQISVNSKPKNFRTQAIAKAWVAKNIPINEEEFNTYVHIDARVPHPLVMGTSTDRRKFFTSFFRLDQLDVERKLFLLELSKLNKLRAAYIELKNEYTLSIEDRLSDEDYKILNTRIDKLKDVLENLNKQNDKLREISRILNFYEAANESIQVLLNICDNNISQESFDTVYKDTKWAYDKDQKDLEDAIEWEEYQRDNKAYLKAYNKLSPDALKLIRKYGIKGSIKECKDAQDKYDSSIRNKKNIKEEIRTLEEFINSEKPKKAKSDDDIGDLRSTLDSTQHKLIHARKFKKGTCSECGQSVKIKDPKILEDKVKDLQKRIANYETSVIYKKYRVEYKAKVEELGDLKATLEKINKSIKSTEFKRNSYDELRSLPSKPKKFEGKKLEVKVKQRMLDEDKERLQLLKFLKPNIDLIIEYFKLTKKQKHAAKLAGELQAAITSKNEKLSTLNGKLELQKALRVRTKRLRARLHEMKVQLKDEKSLKLLVDGYSDKGIKKRAIQAISNRLMLTVNTYAKSVFSEDYSFEFRWDTSQLQLLAHRRYGKKILTSDVRKLSGAESKLFTLILILALLTFVPAHKRASTMVLDEPTANFSKETFEAFSELLPVLNKVIPSIVIITPKSDERYEGATNYTVVKENGVSTLMKGHPSEIKHNSTGIRNTKRKST